MARKQHRGTFKRGQVSETRNQTKWLASQLSEDARHDICASMAYTLMTTTPYLSRHLRDKVSSNELTVDMQTIRETLDGMEANMVEYNETVRFGKTERRVLLRDYGIVHTIMVGNRRVPSNLCFVINIDTACIVTAYWNRAHDRHDTLDERRYERAMLRVS